MPSTSPVTAVPVVTDFADGGGGPVADSMILAALDAEYGLSPETVAGSVPGLTRTDAPGRLQELANAGLVAVDHRNRFTRIERKASA